MNKALHIMIAATALLLVSACEPAGDTSGGEHAQHVTRETATVSKPLAWVNGSAITEEDLTRMIVSSFSTDALGNISNDVRKKVLESLVLARAIAIRAESELDGDSRRALEQELAAHREQLLVKRYLRDHAKQQPVTEASIREYYQLHPDKFGGGTKKIIEIINAGSNVAEAQRAQTFDAVGSAVRNPDWESYAGNLRARGLNVNYARTELNRDILDQRLVRASDALDEGEVSKTILINGLPHLIRVVEVQQLAVRPLDEVRGEIRKMLLPLQVKKAIRQLSGTVLAKADVKYANSINDKGD